MDVVKRVCDVIRDENLSVNGIAMGSGVGQSSLQRFCTGQRGMSLESFDAVCSYLDLELVHRIPDMAEYLNEAWDSWGRDEWLEEDETYQDAKNEAWDDYLSDVNEGRDLEECEYSDWSKEYDELNWDKWVDHRQKEFFADESERTRKLDWVVIENE